LDVPYFFKKIKAVFQMLKKLFLAGTVLLSLFLVNCRKPMADLEFSIGLENIRSVTIWVENANQESPDFYPPGTVLSFSGPDGALVETLNAKVSKTTKEGVSMFLMNGATKKTLKFNVKAEAPGYISSTKAVEYNGEQDLVVKMKLVELAHPPKGVTLVETILVPNSSGEVGARSLKTPLNDKLEQATLDVAQGTKFRKADGSVITSPVNVLLVHFDNRHEESLSSIPSDGLTPANIRNSAGIDDQSIAADPLGAVHLELRSGTEKVASSTLPLSVTMGLDPASSSLEFPGQTIQPGNELVLIGNQPGSSTWTSEQMTTMSTTSTTTFQVSVFNTTTTWELTTKSNFCTNPFSLTVNANADYLEKVWLQILNSSNSKLIAEREVNMVSGEAMQITKLPKVGFYFRMFLDNTKKAQLGQSANFGSCASSGSMTVTLPNPTLTFDIKSRCTLRRDNLGNTLIVPYSGTLYYKLETAPATAAYKTLGTATEGVLTTNKLQWDRTYRFKAVLPSDYTNPNNVSLERVKPVVRDQFTTTGFNSFRFVGTNIIPESICAQIVAKN
jgi:hypothetical protein